MEISILIDKEFESSIKVAWLKSIIERTLVAENVSPNAEISLVITGQEQIRALNRDYRHKDETTDVLSFAMLGNPLGDENPFITAPDGLLHLGEVIISYPQAAIQAKARNYPVEKEITLLLLHGVLHLLGYEHEEPEAAQKMRARETAILKELEGGKP